MYVCVCACVCVWVCVCVWRGLVCIKLMIEIAIIRYLENVFASMVPKCTGDTLEGWAGWVFPQTHQSHLLSEFCR